MRNLIHWLSRRRFPYEPLITVEISQSRLVHNLNEFRKLAPSGYIAPVLKSNAYGHGLYEVARMLEREAHVSHPLRHPPASGGGGQIPFFIVDSYFEALALRARRVKKPLLVIGYTRPETMMRTRLKDVSFVVTSLETLKKISELPFHYFARKAVNIHLKIDTGMRRQGIMPEEIKEAIEIIRDTSSVSLEGVCSHLSDADDPDESFTDGQIHIWNNAVREFRTHFPKIRFSHLSNTDGHRFTKDIEANISRLGIGLYGLSENPEINKQLDLLPVMTMKTIITGVKKLKPGETVGYGNTFKASQDMTIATIPVGYYEGLDRRLSNSGSVLVGESRVSCPIIGRVSMNITTIDITGVPDVTIGTSVIVISDDPKDRNSIVNMARACGTISYEISVKIPAHLKRVITD